MEHLADKLDAGWLVRVLFLELHDESESAILERRICRPDDDCVPLEKTLLEVFVWVDQHCVGRVGTHQVMTLSAMGDAETPAGGSVCIRYTE